MSLQIYMATHKKQDIYNSDIITPIQVGASLTDEDLYPLKDNIGENISDKNRVFCELTALYWIWKNSTVDYVGLCHYRRFFDIQDENKIKNVLNSGKIILPKLAYLGRSVEKQYKHNHDYIIWDTMISVLNTKYPEYTKIADKIFKGNKMYPFNMFIANKEFLNGYCEWLFDILFEVENKVGKKELDKYQQRYAGFLSERMLMVYTSYNQSRLNIYETKITDENQKYITKKHLKTIVNNIFFKLKIGN